MATKSRHLKTAMQLWVADQRKAGDYTSADLAEWTGVTEDTARGWESRGRPSEDAIRILERKFGKAAPVGEAAAPGDQAAVVAAIDRQTAMLKAVLDAIINRLPPEDGATLAALADLAAAEQELAAERRQSESLPRTPRPAHPDEGRRSRRRSGEAAG